MKTIKVKLLGSKTDPRVIQITPGVKAGDLLCQSDLAGYALYLPFSTRGYLATDEEVYEAVVDGDLLLAMLKPSPAMSVEEDPDTPLDGAARKHLDIDAAREELLRLVKVKDE